MHTNDTDTRPHRRHAPGKARQRAAQETIRILLLEDSASDAALALHELRRLEPGIESHRVDNEGDFRSAIAEFAPDIILSDFSMPGAFDGLAALDIARATVPDVPFVFVSGTIGEDRAVEALRRGATDYVLKDRMSRLAPVVRRALRETGDRKARRRAEQWRDEQNRILELIASGDPLPDVLRQLILTVESQSDGMLCSILLLDAEGKRLRTGAAPTLPEEFSRATDGIPIGPAAGSCGTAAYRKAQVIVTDIAGDPLWEEYRDHAARHGLCACWSTPVLSRNGRLLGTFANYFRTRRSPTGAELELVASAIHIARIAIQKRDDEAEILRAKERLDLALEASNIALWDSDVPSGRVYLSDHWAKMLDDEPRETVTTVPELAEIAHPEDRQTLLALSRDTILGHRRSYEAEHRVRTKDGQWKWILSRGKVVERTPDGLALRVIGTNMEITERKLQEQRIARLSRIRAVSSGVRSIIVRTRDREELFREACRIAVEHGNFGVACIALLDRATQRVAPVAWAGVGTDALKRVDSSTRADARQGQGTVGRAIRERRPAFENDLSLRPDLGGGIRREALELGLHSAIALPLVTDQEVTGTLTLLARETGFFTDEEVKPLAELADDISFALQSIDRQEKLDYLSYYDPITGLPNRSLFIDRAGQQMRARDGETHVAAMVLLDLERFRYINETLGRHGGDDVLKLVAQRLDGAFHGKDYIARIGADSFGVVMRSMRDAAAVMHAVENQILGCFGEPFRLNGTELRVAAKAGIAVFPADGADADTLFKNAEAALKQAKASRERHLFYAADMNARAAQALSLETRLRKAVEADQFVLHYQPKIDIASGAVCGLEALIRWQDPQSGLVAPGVFIPMLEDTGLILEVGRWAVRHALSQRLAWHIAGLRPPNIAVNVSAIQLRRPDFVRTICDSLDTVGVCAHGLDLEITESVVMEDIEGNIGKLRAVGKRGVKIAVDDFGTGYSSLAYLAKLPIDELKIDRSFIASMVDDANSMTIVSTIISLAHSLNLAVIAEGVETAEQRNLLRVLKCDRIQGYFISKPLPAADIPALLREKAKTA